jgi:hypothetical protein
MRSLSDEVAWFALKTELNEAYGFRADSLSEKYAQLMKQGKVKEAKALQDRHRAAVRKEDAQIKKMAKKPTDNGVHEGTARRTVKKAMRGEAPTTARGKRAVRAALDKSPSKQKKVDLDVAAKVYDHQLRHAQVEDLHELLPALVAAAAPIAAGAARLGAATVRTVGKVGTSMAKGALKLGATALKGSAKAGAKTVAKAPGKIAQKGAEMGKQKLVNMKFNQMRKAAEKQQAQVQKQPGRLAASKGNGG